jgi:Fic family protein
MVKIRKEDRKSKTYYYLEHSYRDNKLIKKKQLYLGKSIPENIEKLKQDFISKIYNEKWLNKINIIKKNFSRELNKTPKSAKEKNIENFIIKFTYNTQRIEGSTLSLKETADLLEKNITPNKKPIEDVKEAENHKTVFYEMLGYKKDLTYSIILYWHKKLFQETKKDIAGKIRNHQVAIARSKFTPPLPVELSALLNEFFDWYSNNKKIHPVELAALVHLKFVTIHPFSDGNGRISRLLMNFILKKYNFPLLDIRYENRTSYYNALERSQIKKQNDIFIQWFFRKYLKEFKNYLK